MKAEAESYLEKETDEEKKLFYKSVSIVMEGAVNFILRYRDQLNEQAKDNDEWAENMRKVANVCDNISKYGSALSESWSGHRR